MEPPLCRTCERRHWSRLCYEPRNEPVTPRVTPVTKTLAVACSQCQLYEAEIKRLKRALASAHAEPKVVMSAAERMKKMRAKKANASVDK